MIQLAMAWLPVVALLLVRFAPLTWAVPLFARDALPWPARFTVWGMLVAVVVPAVALPSGGGTLAGWIDAAMREAMIGGALAVILGAPWIALTQAGRLVDVPREVPSPVGTLLRGTFAVAFLAAGGLRAVIRAVVGSVLAVPPRWSPAGDPSRWLEATLRWSAEGLAASVTMVGATVVAVFATEWTLALAARFSPTLGRSGLALPARTLVMLGVLAATVSLWTGTALDLGARALEAARALTG